MKKTIGQSHKKATKEEDDDVAARIIQSHIRKSVLHKQQGLLDSPQNANSVTPPGVGHHQVSTPGKKKAKKHAKGGGKKQCADVEGQVKTQKSAVAKGGVKQQCADVEGQVKKEKSAVAKGGVKQQCADVKGQVKKEKS